MGVAEHPTGEALAPGVGVLMPSLPHAQRVEAARRARERENTTIGVCLIREIPGEGE
jgi:hypothetical protein